MANPDDPFERGKREGKTEQRLDDHDEHLDRINGNIRDFAAAAAQLAKEIAKFGDDARLDRERVRVAAATLAEVTEQRREDVETQRLERAENLAGSTFKWTKGYTIATVLLTVVFTVLGITLKHYGIV